MRDRSKKEETDNERKVMPERGCKRKSVTTPIVVKKSKPVRVSASEDDIDKPQSVPVAVEEPESVPKVPETVKKATSAELEAANTPKPVDKIVENDIEFTEPDPELNNGVDITDCCLFCNKNEEDDSKYGPLLNKEDIRAHLYCLLFSDELDYACKSFHEGFFGFDIEEIRKKVQQNKQQICNYCLKPGAHITCQASACHITYHLPCALDNGIKLRLMGQFITLCDKNDEAHLRELEEFEDQIFQLESESGNGMPDFRYDFPDWISKTQAVLRRIEIEAKLEKEAFKNGNKNKAKSGRKANALNKVDFMKMLDVRRKPFIFENVLVPCDQSSMNFLSESEEPLPSCITVKTEVLEGSHEDMSPEDCETTESSSSFRSEINFNSDFIVNQNEPDLDTLDEEMIDSYSSDTLISPSMPVLDPQTAVLLSPVQPVTMPVLFQEQIVGNDEVFTVPEPVFDVDVDTTPNYLNNSTSASEVVVDASITSITSSQSDNSEHPGPPSAENGTVDSIAPSSENFTPIVAQIGPERPKNIFTSVEIFGKRYKVIGGVSTRYSLQVKVLSKTISI